MDDVLSALTSQLKELQRYKQRYGDLPPEGEAKPKKRVSGQSALASPSKERKRVSRTSR